MTMIGGMRCPSPISPVRTMALMMRPTTIPIVVAPPSLNSLAARLVTSRALAMPPLRILA